MTTIDRAAAENLQASWDRQQETHLPHREEAFAVLVDAVEAMTGGRGSVLDLAGGTGSLTSRLAGRLPDIDVTVLDLDPVLLAIASASLPPAVGVVRGDLGDPRWIDALPHRHFDAVLTTTSMHCFTAGRVGEIYREVARIVRPGGMFVNADRMADGGLSRLAARLDENVRRRVDPADTWARWWQRAVAEPAVAPLVAERSATVTQPSADWYPPAAWHQSALDGAGFADTGLLWRRGDQAAVAALRAADRPEARRSHRRRRVRIVPSAES